MLIEKLTSWVRARLAGPELRVEPPVLPVVETPPVVERPQSAVELLRNEPNLDAATLAVRAGVTLSYARSLIRRRQTKTFVQAQVSDYIMRTPASLSRRTQVLDRKAAGIASKRIAEELSMPLGEVDFILKIDRLKKSLEN